MLPSEIKAMKMQDLRTFAKEQGVKVENTDTKEALQAKVLGTPVEDVERLDNSAIPESPILSEAVDVVAVAAEIQVPKAEPVIQTPTPQEVAEVVVDSDKGALLPEGIMPRIRELQEKAGMTYDIDTEALCVTFRRADKAYCETLRQDSHKILEAAEKTCSRIIRPADVGVHDNMRGAF